MTGWPDGGARGEVRGLMGYSIMGTNKWTEASRMSLCLISIWCYYISSCGYYQIKWDKLLSDPHFTYAVHSNTEYNISMKAAGHFIFCINFV